MPEMMLIDRFMPVFQFKEEHTAIANVPAGRLLDAAMHPETTDDPWARLFIRLREAPDRIRGKLGARSGLQHRPAFGLSDFVMLGRDGDRELALGLVGRFWLADYGLVAMTNPHDFEQFNTPGVAKLVLNFSTTTHADGRTCLTTQTRVYCNDRNSVWRFTPYWWLIRPVSGVIRKRLLGRITRAASSQDVQGA